MLEHLEIGSNNKERKRKKKRKGRNIIVIY
jgi:hypothetical protein